MKIVKVTCDGCGHDLTTRWNSVDYRLVLASESKPSNGAGSCADMMIYPSIERPHHFCRLDCLDLWRDREKHCSKLWSAWWGRWKAEYGTDDGRLSSCPQPPRDVLDACELEFKADALSAFPMKESVP